LLSFISLLTQSGNFWIHPRSFDGRKLHCTKVGGLLVEEVLKGIPTRSWCRKFVCPCTTTKVASYIGNST